MSNSIQKGKLIDLISDISYANARDFYFEAIYNTHLTAEEKISTIRNFNYNSKQELLRKSLEINKIHNDVQKKIPSNCLLFKNLEKNKLEEWKQVLKTLKNDKFPFYEHLPK